MKSVINFREMGGGTLLKKGMLYRSGSLDKARGKDLDQIRALQVKTIIDLRSAPEYRTQSGAPVEARKVALPLSFDGIAKVRLQRILWKKGVEERIMEVINSVYHDFTDLVCEEIGEIFRTLLREDAYPVLIHCRAGKDRTGFVCALIQMALGVEQEAIVQDYLKSNEYVLPKARRILRMLKIFTLGWFPARNLLLTFTVQEKYIRTIIRKINDGYGGIERYLERCGVSGSELRRLREILVEKEK